MAQTQMTSAPAPKDTRPTWKRFLKRSRWEMVAVVVISLGVVMLMQPLSLALYSYSFVTLLVGTGLFTIVTKFPE
jgi:hypothetical protein